MALTPADIRLPERYRVLAHVATGGMATVYAAADEALGRKVAVKVLAEALSADPASRARFTREARAGARVSDHPHVVTVYDVGEHDGLAFIVMELLTGGTVGERIKSGAPIPHALALRWLDDAASALDAAHRVDVVHRDVKPANLLLDGTGTLKVADFGIATLASEAPLTQTGQVVGTAAYFSPEQALGHPATPASDRYALAVVAFELLTGRRPFPAAAPAAQARAHVDTDPPRASQVAPNLPRGVDAVLARGLAKDPAERPSSACRFVEELRDALGPTAVTAVAAGQRFDRPGVPPVGVAIPDPGRPPTLRPAAPRAPRPPAGGDGVVRSRTRSRRLGPLAAALAVLLIAGAALAAVLGSGGGRAGSPGAAADHGSTSGARHPSTASAPAAASTPAAAPTSKSAGEAQGHALIAQGRYADAAGVLRGVVQDCPVQVTDPCAFAWYDLGHALRLAGDPAAAIPVLQTRLQNPNQRGVVEQELALAQAQAGGGPPKGKAKGHGKGGDGGD